MKIILIGGPSSGKGVQAKKICEKYNLTHISTGELLREEINKHTALADKLKQIITAGNLVDDEIVFSLVKNKIVSANYNYLLDGFPRTLKQAKLFELFDRPDMVILLETDVEISLNRLMKRRVCLNCKASLNVDELVNNHCPYCSGTVSTRIDDSPEIFKNRFEIYKMQFAPLIKHYNDMGVLYRVQNNGTIDETFGNIDKYLKN